MRLDGAAKVSGGPSIVKAVETLRRVPDDVRDYAVSPPEAEKGLGLSPAAVKMLMAAGLPHRADEDAVWFNGADLTYLAIRLGSARPHLAAFAFIARSLEQFATSVSTELRVRCIPRLPREMPQVPGTVVWPDGARRELDLTHNRVAAEVAITVRSPRRATPRALSGIVAAAGALELYSLPRSLVGNIEFARRTGLSECLTAAHLVAECCRDAGYEARVAEGLMVAVPWSNPHYWCEVSLDDEWLALDPLMIRALRAFGGLDARSWPDHRSPAPMLARFPPGAFPIVTRRSDGTRVETTFLTSIRRP